jgi:hypothetical protein
MDEMVRGRNDGVLMVTVLFYNGYQISRNKRPTKISHERLIHPIYHS